MNCSTVVVGLVKVLVDTRISTAFEDQLVSGAIAGIETILERFERD